MIKYHCCTRSPVRGRDRSSRQASPAPRGNRSSPGRNDHRDKDLRPQRQQQQRGVDVDMRQQRDSEAGGSSSRRSSKNSSSEAQQQQQPSKKRRTSGDRRDTDARWRGRDASPKSRLAWYSTPFLKVTATCIKKS